MVSTVSKKYTKALTASLSEAELQSGYAALSKVADALKIAKFHDILGSQDISLEQKAALIAEISDNKDAKVSNLFSLLLKAKKVEIVPAIAEEVREFLSAKSGRASGVISASFEIDASDIQEIAKVLGSRLHREIELSFKKTDSAQFDGIKVEVEDLGVEVEINKDALKKSVIAHILNTTKIF